MSPVSGPCRWRAALSQCASKPSPLLSEPLSQPAACSHLTSRKLQVRPLRQETRQLATEGAQSCVRGCPPLPLGTGGSHRGCQAGPALSVWERAVPVPYVSSVAAFTLQAWSCVAETDPAAHGARSTHCLRVYQGGLPSPGLEDAKPLVLLRTPQHLSGTPHCRNLFIFQKRRVVLLLTE